MELGGLDVETDGTSIQKGYAWYLEGKRIE